MRGEAEARSRAPKIFEYRELVRGIDRTERVCEARGWEVPPRPGAWEEGHDVLFFSGDRMGALRGKDRGAHGFRACVAVPYGFGDFAVAMEVDPEVRPEVGSLFAAELWVYFFPLESDDGEELWQGRVEVPRAGGAAGEHPRVETLRDARRFDWRCLSSKLTACDACPDDRTCWAICVASHAIECATRT